jgi:hypothetical protein
LTKSFALGSACGSEEFAAIEFREEDTGTVLVSISNVGEVVEGFVYFADALKNLDDFLEVAHVEDWQHQFYMPKVTITVL